MRRNLHSSFRSNASWFLLRLTNRLWVENPIFSQFFWQSQRFQIIIYFHSWKCLRFGCYLIYRFKFCLIEAYWNHYFNHFFDQNIDIRLKRYLQLRTTNISLINFLKTTWAFQTGRFLSNKHHLYFSMIWQWHTVHYTFFRSYSTFASDCR